HGGAGSRGGDHHAAGRVHPQGQPAVGDRAAAARARKDGRTRGDGSRKDPERLDRRPPAHRLGGPEEAMNPAVLLGAVLSGGGLGTALVAQGMRKRRKVSNLKALLEAAYLEEIDKPAGAAEHQMDVRRLVAQTTQAAERALAGTKLLGTIKVKIERSDWKLSPGEFVSVTLGLAAAGFVVGLLAGSGVLAVLLAGFAVVGPYL